MLNSYYIHGQDVAIKIKSEQKLLFNGSQHLKDVAAKVNDDNQYLLKLGISDWLRYEVKQRATSKQVHRRGRIYQKYRGYLQSIDVFITIMHIAE